MGKSMKPHLTAADIEVLGAIHDMSGGAGGVVRKYGIWKRVNQEAGRTGPLTLSRPVVDTALSRLETMGYIRAKKERLSRSDSRGRRQNLFFDCYTFALSDEVGRADSSFWEKVDSARKVNRRLQEAQTAIDQILRGLSEKRR